MYTNFQIIGIDKNEFQHLFQLTDTELQKIGANRQTVKSKPGYPCRVSLTDAEIGEEVILFPYEHHQTDAPYQAKGPIFIKKNAKNAALNLNEIPKMLTHRFLSLRGYDQDGMMLEAATVNGVIIETSIQELFENPLIAYIHAHNAGPGCFNCEIRRN